MKYVWVLLIIILLVFLYPKKSGVRYSNIAILNGGKLYREESRCIGYKFSSFNPTIWGSGHCYDFCDTYDFCSGIPFDKKCYEVDQGSASGARIISCEK